MRNHSITAAGLLALLVLVLTACGSTSSPTPTPSQLFSAYTKSTTVKNDQYRGRTSADRLAEFAAEGTPRDVESAMFSMYWCTADELGCPPSASTTAAAARFAGHNTAFQARTILVQHQGGQLELMPLYVATNAAGATELIDSTGQAYRGGMPDFQQHNDLLTPEDLILAPDNITAASGTFSLVVLAGHTQDGTGPWVIVTVVILIVLVASALVFTLIRLRRPRSQ